MSAPSDLCVGKQFPTTPYQQDCHKQSTAERVDIFQMTQSNVGTVIYFICLLIYSFITYRCTTTTCSDIDHTEREVIAIIFMLKNSNSVFQFCAVIPVVLK